VTVVADLYITYIVAPGKQALFLLLVAFILTFLFIRFSVRMIRAEVSWWPGNISSGDVHVHHVVFGTVLMFVAGLLAFAPAGWESPWWEILGALFGIGAALVLDEFALILHLSDVYWAEDGRTSVDAVFAAIAVAGLLMLGFNPLSFFDIGIWENDHSILARTSVVLLAVFTLLLAVVVLLKGKVWTGLVGMFITPLLFVGAIRLSRPHAPWARWRYTTRPRRMHKALERERWLRRPVIQAKLWLQDAISGMPKFPDDAEVDKELDREIHAAPAPPRSTSVEVA
jgi:hypothetical protein